MTPPLPLAEAQLRLLQLVHRLPVEEIAVSDALGHYLAEPLLARRTQPPADLSAMDGYALGSGAWEGPWTVIGESAAGHPFTGTLATGQAIRISTGAAMPVASNTVLLQEDARREGDRLALAGDRPTPGRHIRRTGFDFRDGEHLADAQTRITPALIALALSGGHANLTLPRRPRIAIIDSGDELAADPTRCAPHQIPASNGPMLRALFATLPCDIKIIGPIADDRDEIVAAFQQAGNADLIVTSGGASVGDHDLIRPALEQWGADLAFWRVAMKPGKPLMVATKEGHAGRQLVLGLPGNPVSCHVTAWFFALPIIRAMLGSAAPFPSPVEVPCSAPLPAGGKRTEFVRAIWNGTSATPLPEQDSSALRALAMANALIERPVNAEAETAGSMVRMFLLQNGGIA